MRLLLVLLTIFLICKMTKNNMTETFRTTLPSDDRDARTPKEWKYYEIIQNMNIQSTDEIYNKPAVEKAASMPSNLNPLYQEPVNYYFWNYGKVPYDTYFYMYSGHRAFSQHK